ncbi:hypothetical protein CgunFtcFv8_009176 [Champsocephalus gunnari]|uniref:THAP-type domain-containing protein n=1 Tax=Champsocephalus gunnari TaxID=52237 RepID=A0AAN8D3S4_CHAGU|nr:hypothetical protein CgunFtcFv8_009176 [Champsocephalus gunnari]
MNWSPSISSRLCSAHFEKDQFLEDNEYKPFKKGERRLKPTAVPTIFTFEGEKKGKEAKPSSPRLRPAASPSTQNTVKTPVAVVQGAPEDLIEGTTSRGSQTSPPRTPTKREQMSVWRDHCYFTSESPRALKRRAEAPRQQLAAAPHKKMKTKCQQTRRVRCSLLALKTEDTALRTRLKEVEEALAAFRK